MLGFKRMRLNEGYGPKIGIILVKDQKSHQELKYIPDGFSYHNLLIILIIPHPRTDIGNQ